MATAQQHKALDRACTSRAMTNYPAILSGFMERGIPQHDIRPRENVFTFGAWKALGRFVRKGEKGVKILSWIPIPEKKNDAGDVERKAGRRPKTAHVFHVSQTDAVETPRVERTNA